MKKLLYLFLTVLIVGCGGEDTNNNGFDIIIRFSFDFGVDINNCGNADYFSYTSEMKIDGLTTSTVSSSGNSFNGNREMTFNGQNITPSLCEIDLVLDEQYPKSSITNINLTVESASDNQVQLSQDFSDLYICDEVVSSLSVTYDFQSGNLTYTN
tara:strand:+ start:23 stop:487 length:465 start_codon:yes stop_codon:yes gene_type:complete